MSRGPQDSGREPVSHGGSGNVQADVDRWRVRSLAVRVFVVQLLALAVLWALQARFGGF